MISSGSQGDRKLYYLFFLLFESSYVPLPFNIQLNMSTGFLSNQIRILIDPGSSINLMPRKVIDSLTLSSKYFSNEKIAILKPKVPKVDGGSDLAPPIRRIGLTSKILHHRCRHLIQGSHRAPVAARKQCRA